MIFTSSAPEFQDGGKITLTSFRVKSNVFSFQFTKTIVDKVALELRSTVEIAEKLKKCTLNYSLNETHMVTGHSHGNSHSYRTRTLALIQ